MIAYRYLEPQYLDDALHARFMLRRLSFYRSIESPDRRDSLEGSVEGYITEHTFTNVQPGSDDAKILEAMGIRFLDGGSLGSGTVRRTSSVQRSEDLFILSLSGIINPVLSTEGRSATIKVGNVVRLAQQIVAKNATALIGFKVARVVYENRVFDPRKLLLEPDPFKKAREYRHEDEIRIAFRGATAGDCVLTERIDTDLIKEYRPGLGLSLV
jgi:hypothetical protein